MKILNLGCGHKVSAHPDIVNIDWSIYLSIRNSKILSAFANIVLDTQRLSRLEKLPHNIFSYDLSRGIPFSNNSVDAIFHSNMLEHLDRKVARKFLFDALNILKPGGIHRIVVPDFEYLCRNYIKHISLCEIDPLEKSQHDNFIALLLEQSVRKESASTQSQRPIRRFIENLILGDARRRGETHQWMYDRINLEVLLSEVGYRDIKLMQFDRSAIPNWQKYGLDIYPDGSEYAQGSFYMEARK
jgi:hypothetical protein